jgi:beta-glucosidase
MDEIPREAPQLSIGNTNHYLDYGFKPMFPFGYGLSYTSFEYSDIQVADTLVSLGDSITLSAKLKNTGKVTGTEVTQLYIRDLAANRTRPVKELKAYKRVKLQPNEVKDIIFKIHTNQLGFHNQEMKYVTEPGEFRAWIGGSSDAELSAGFIIKQD